MSEGDQNQGEKLLEEFEVGGELNIIVEQDILPQKIAQRIKEKLKEKNIRVTKNQLYKLVEKIQRSLHTLITTSPNQTEQSKKMGTSTLLKEEEKTFHDSTIQTTDMRQLVEAVEQLNERIKIIEENRIEGVKGVTGKLVKTKDIRAFEPSDILNENMQPLEQIPSDPESIVITMKWLQYLVDRTGKNNLGDALGYYVDIGWISEDVRLDLINYSKGITEEPTQAGAHLPHLPTRDHLQSLLFIQKLRGFQLDDRFLSKIERDMEKIVKSLEGYQQK
ncbi:MAG TPA: FlaD/FlaE family flagellar protein [Candidatus Thermoplasmatota archaeon]|nr:FlaD/FlaE family flagellar protein [Candidatus Thermoplasmatota archaeon]